MNPQAAKVWPIFVGVWIVLTIASFSLQFFNRNAALKRKLNAPCAIFVGALFLFFLWFMGMPPQTLIVAAVFVVLIDYLTIRNTRYCDICGASQFFASPYSPPLSCERCGSSLEARRELPK